MERARVAAGSRGARGGPSVAAAGDRLPCSLGMPKRARDADALEPYLERVLSKSSEDAGDRLCTASEAWDSEPTPSCDYFVRLCSFAESNLTGHERTLFFTLKHMSDSEIAAEIRRHVKSGLIDSDDAEELTRPRPPVPRSLRKPSTCCYRSPRGTSPSHWRVGGQTLRLGEVLTLQRSSPLA